MVDVLSKYDKHILISGDRINDNVVYATQSLILQANPHTYVWFSKYKLMLSIQHQNISNSNILAVVIGLLFGCKSAEVNVYDSMRTVLTDSLKRQISAILCLPIQRKKVILKYEQILYYY